MLSRMDAYLKILPSTTSIITSPTSDLIPPAAATLAAIAPPILLRNDNRIYII